MITLINEKTALVNRNEIIKNKDFAKLDSLNFSKEEIANGEHGTISYKILNDHNIGSEENLKIKFDSLASHDITYVGIVQTARASGLKKFPVPYVLTNCHNSLCAVGGTINEDDHVFGLSAAKKYGGIYVPAHLAVIHQYMREQMTGCGRMILGSDSHTRYGALGTMAIGEGGPELVKQLLQRTYDVNMPEIIMVYLTGNVRRGVGPQDVALSIIGKVFQNSFVKNKVMEFVGPGIENLSADFRCGIDVMTTETTCLSSIWKTDDTIKEYYKTVKRPKDFKVLDADALAIYDGAIIVELDKIEPMIAMPYHPSNVYKLADVIGNPFDILTEVENNANGSSDSPGISLKLTDKIIDGKIMVSQGIIAGCAGGTYENIFESASIIENKNCGNGEFNLNIYPASQPVYLDLLKKDVITNLVMSGAVVKTAFCGPCFGAGDTPSNNAFSIRHTTRNFPNREGSKPNNGQIASVALMDARSIAATAANSGVLTSAFNIEYNDEISKFHFDDIVYKKRVYSGFSNPQKMHLKYGPNIADWPKMIPLTKNILIKLSSVITDSVTTTDELIPSGETSSYRSNPLKLAEFTLSRKDPEYVKRAKFVFEDELKRRTNAKVSIDCMEIFELLGGYDKLKKDTLIGSGIYAKKPGDGSAREQAASCQRVLGGCCNIAAEYATKRYKSNLINWGMIPFLSSFKDFKVDDYIFIENIYDTIKAGQQTFLAKLISNDKIAEIELKIDALTAEEREIILSGCLINYYNK